MPNDNWMQVIEDRVISFEKNNPILMQYFKDKKWLETVYAMDNIARDYKAIFEPKVRQMHLVSDEEEK